MTLPPGKIGDHRWRRYEIRARDGDGNTLVLGWSDDPDAFREAIELHPSLHDRKVIDRAAAEAEED